MQVFPNGLGCDNISTVIHVWDIDRDIIFVSEDVEGESDMVVEKFRHSEISPFDAHEPVEVANRDSMHHSPTVECPILDTHAR